MFGSQKSTHELVRARINVLLRTLDLLFSIPRHELYAGMHSEDVPGRWEERPTALWKMCCLAPFLENTLLTTRPASFFSATAIAASTTSRGADRVEVDAAVEAIEEG